MVAPRNSLLAISILICSCASFAESTAYKVSVDNQLKECLTINKVESYASNGMPMLKFDYKTVSSTADCGCKSALSSYSAHAIYENYESYLIGGKMRFEEKGEILLPAATSASIIGSSEIKVYFSCANPD